MEPDGDLHRPDRSARPLAGTEVFATDEAGNRLPPGEQSANGGPRPQRDGRLLAAPRTDRAAFYRVAGLFPELHTGDYGWVDTTATCTSGPSRRHVQGAGFPGQRGGGGGGRPPGARGGNGRRAATRCRPGRGGPVRTGDADPQHVQRQLRDELEDFKVPQRCLARPELPVNANGKTDKKVLLAMLQEEARV